MSAQVGVACHECSITWYDGFHWVDAQFAIADCCAGKHYNIPMAREHVSALMKQDSESSHVKPI